MGPLGPTTIADLVERAAPAVVNIDTLTRRSNPLNDLDPYFHHFFGSGSGRLPRHYDQKGVGSGFIIDGSGLVVTNHHVTRGVTKIWVTLSDGRKFEGRVIGKDPASDLALVKIPASKLPVLSFADPKTIRVGDWAVAIGSPLGLSTTVTFGIVSAVNRDVSNINERVSFLQTDAPINPGNSGGPLLNLAGQVIGVNTAIAARAQGIGFAIPADTVRFVVSELRTKGRVDRAWLGVVIAALEADQAKVLFTEPGVVVREVDERGPAAKAGLRRGDLILRIDDQPVREEGDVIRLIGGKRIGQTVRLLILRNGSQYELSMTLSPMPSDLIDDAEDE